VAAGRVDSRDRRAWLWVNVVAHVGLLSSLYRHSHRLVQQAMLDLFGVEMSLVSICGKKPVAVAEAVAAVGEYVQHQPVVGMDETSFIQGNSDGNNPQHTKGWLWVTSNQLLSCG